MPVEKSVRVHTANPQQAFDILHNDNICLAGTSVTTGNGYALVLLTSKETYLASIAKELEKKRPLNAMQIGIRKVSYILLTFMLVSIWLFL
jgi:P-type Mg2+ transporter